MGQFPSVEHQFKPGWRGGPGGQRKDSITERVKKLLEAYTIAGKPIPGNRQIADLVAEGIIKDAIKGKPSAVALLLERTEGKVPDTLRHEGNLEMTIRYVNDWRGPIEHGDSAAVSSSGPDPGTNGSPAIQLAECGPAVAEDNAGNGHCDRSSDGPQADHLGRADL